LTHTEENFVATVDTSSMPREDVIADTELTCPKFPLDFTVIVLPDNLDVAERALVSSLVMD